MNRRHERRRNRSKYPAIALHYQLRYCAEFYGIDAMTLADSRGMVVASSEQSEVDEVIAAYAPMICSQQRHPAQGRAMAALRRAIPGESRRFSVRRVEVEGEELYLCAVGDRGIDKDRAVRRAARGTARILSC